MIIKILLVDDHVGEANEQTCFFVDRVGHTMSHRGYQEVSHVGRANRPYADANFLALALRHGLLLPLRRLSLAFPAKELLTLAQLLVLVLAHLLPSFLQDA